MPKRSSKKNIRDINLLASHITEEATGQPAPKPEDSNKNPAAVALGRLGGLKGGKARAEKLTPEQRTEIAIKLALLVYKNKHFKLWAKNWLNNQDRSANAARYAADAADAVYAAQFVSDVAIKININSIIQEVLNESKGFNKSYLR